MPVVGFAIRGRELVVYLMAESEAQRALLAKLDREGRKVMLVDRYATIRMPGLLPVALDEEDDFEPADAVAAAGAAGARRGDRSRTVTVTGRVAATSRATSRQTSRGTREVERNSSSTRRVAWSLFTARFRHSSAARGAARAVRRERVSIANGSEERSICWQRSNSSSVTRMPPVTRLCLRG